MHGRVDASCACRKPWKQNKHIVKQCVLNVEIRYLFSIRAQDEIQCTVRSEVPRALQQRVFRSNVCFAAPQRIFRQASVDMHTRSSYMYMRSSLPLWLMQHSLNLHSLSSALTNLKTAS